MIEQTISALITAINELTLAINSAKTGATTVPQAAAPVAPVTQPAPVVPAPAYAAPMQMPAPPTFAPPAFTAPAAPVAPSAPFTDGAGLIAYVMAAYKEMGPAKGANIQGVLTSLGYQNINDVKPEHYAGLFQGVEALKKG